MALKKETDMMQALELLSPVGLLFAGAGSMLALVTSGFVAYNFFRRAIGRQIKAETANTNKEVAETLTRIEVQASFLVEQGKAHGEAIAEQGKAFSEALQQQDKNLREEMKHQEGRTGEQLRDIRARMSQLEMKVDKTAADVNWIRGVLEGFGREPEKRIEPRTSVSEWREEGDNASP